MKASKPPTYGTPEERALLEEWAERPTALMLLSNYIAFADKRKVWNDIDKAECVAYARVLYANAQAKADTMQKLARVA